MSLVEVVGVGLLGGLGAAARFALDGTITERLGREFPYGTLLVNLIGSFLLGVMAGAALARGAYEVLGVGLIGAFTTFSTWIFESHRLGEDHRSALAAVNLLGSLALGLAFAWAGRKVGSAL